MGSLNRVFLMGNLTRDPEMRHIPSGTAVSDLGLAVSETYQNKAGEKVETVCFADIVVWGKTAENCHEYLHKGSPVMIEGKLQFDQWKTETGEKRSRLKVRADRVQFLGRPKNGKAGEPRDSAAAGAEKGKEADREESSAIPF